MEHYKYKALQSGTSQWITSLLTEGCGIRSIARLLAVSVTTVLKRIRSISKSITKPAIAPYKEYEIDELCTCYKSKNRLLWIGCALQKNTGAVVDFAVGSRTLNTLRRVTDTVLIAGTVKEQISLTCTAACYPIAYTVQSNTALTILKESI